MTTKMRWFKFYPGDWSVDTQGMSAHAKGAYIDMLCMQWSGRRLPADPVKLARIFPQITLDTYEELLQHFHEVDGWLVNQRLEDERSDARSRSENGKTAAKKKWNASAECDGNATPDAAALPNRMAEQCDTLCHKESEAEAEEETEEEEETQTEVCSATRDARAKPTDTIAWSFDDGWTGISEKDRTDWGIAYPAVDLDVELVRADQWLKGHPAQARKKLWRAFLTRWFGKEQERGGSRKGTPAGAPRSPEQYRPFNAPEDCDPSEYHRFRTPDGRPCSPSIYLTKGGRRRFITGEWYDDVIGGPPALPPAQTADEIALFGKISPRRGSQTDVA